ncbi:MAG: peptidylprolyl isomerase [Bacteroidota bacterium]
MSGKWFIGGFALFAVLWIGGCRGKSAVLAEVNGRTITEEEFAPRYRKYLANTSERDNIVVRKKVLTNMVNEQLIFQDIHRQGFDRDKKYEDRKEDVVGQAILDGYAKLLTTDTMTVGESELLKEFRAYNTQLNARFVYGRTLKEARELRTRLLKGESFNTLAKEVFADPDLAANGGSIGFFGYGDLDPALEEAAYALPVGTLSEPVKMRMGYGIIRIDKRVEKPLASEYDFAKAKPKLEESIRQKKLVRYLKQEADRIESDLAPKFQQDAVELLANNWTSIVEATAPQETGGRSSVSGQSTMVLVTFRNEQWTIGKFLGKLERTRKKDRSAVKSAEDVEGIARGLAIREVMMEKATEKGVKNDPRVQDQIKTILDDFLLRRWADSVGDTVTEASLGEKVLREEFEKNKEAYTDPPQADVAEILVRTEAQAKEVRTKLDRGANFASLARVHSVRTGAAQRGGELGFLSKPLFGDLGDQIFGAKVGEVIGPVFLKPYFGFYRIQGFRKARQKHFDEARKDLVQSILPARKQQAFAAAVDRLRAQASITMNIEALGNVVVSSNEGTLP